MAVDEGVPRTVAIRSTNGPTGGTGSECLGLLLFGRYGCGPWFRISDMTGLWALHCFEMSYAVKWNFGAGIWVQIFGQKTTRRPFSPLAHMMDLWTFSVKLVCNVTLTLPHIGQTFQFCQVVVQGRRSQGWTPPSGSHGDLTSFDMFWFPAI